MKSERSTKPRPQESGREMARARSGNRLANALIEWFEANKRDLPWRRTRDPYRIWISEVMLQQTRAATVVPYYERFIRRFPNVAALASAGDGDLMKAWEGLGYYARAGNLRAAARMIVSDHHGKLPTSKDELLRLPGFGPYTAAAVASLAFGEDSAAVDGNVVRVLTRVHNIDADIRKTATRRLVHEHADRMVPAGRAGVFNEALMELGALVCLPREPACVKCPLRRGCGAYKERRTEKIPVKSPRPVIPRHEIAIGVVHRGGKVLIALRPAAGLLGNLWEFPGGKRRPDESLADCCRREIKEETNLDVEVIGRFAVVRHSYSHFRITLHAYHCRYTGGKAEPRASQTLRWVGLTDLERYAFPKANKEVLAALLDV